VFGRVHNHDDLPMKAAQAVVSALDLMGIPGAVLESAGKPVASNRRLERLIPGVIRGSDERLQLANAAADEIFGDALTKLRQGRGESGRSIPIPAAGTSPPVIIHLFALNGLASEAFSEALSLLAVSHIARRDAPSIPIIQGLFDMTPAEARIAQAVAQGHTLEAIATRLGLSRQTLRSQIRAALAKAGCKRNIELAALLGGMGSTAG
jgi:DNA-binding CsgD family transcriptional regulator